MGEESGKYQNCSILIFSTKLYFLQRVILVLILQSSCLLFAASMLTNFLIYALPITLTSYRGKGMCQFPS